MKRLALAAVALLAALTPAGAQRASTASSSVSVLAPAFPIPQLVRDRRVWLYLPPDYHTSTKRYPVIYMHDGQNLFDAATAFAGEWGIDETLDSLHRAGDWGAIVVGIENGGTRRLDEYNPWKHADPKYGGGEGLLYLDWIVTRLKPFVDARYRTRSDRMNTAIAGSSLGGLISLYAGVRFPATFGNVGVFSCACWLGDPAIYTAVRSVRPQAMQSRFYLVSGDAETPDGSVTRDQARIVTSLQQAGFYADTVLRAVTRSDGKHAEWFWRREFPAAYAWLFPPNR